MENRESKTGEFNNDRTNKMNQKRKTKDNKMKILGAEEVQ